MSKLLFTLPKYTVEYAIQAFSEVYDWGLLDLNIPEVHKKTMGEGIKVAIVDSGQSEHSETLDAIVNSKNFSSSPHLADKAGHSTFCAGIIAARKNDSGVIGVAPKCSLYFAKALDDSGTGTPSAITQAVNWCVDQKVDIISISAGMFVDFPPLHKAVQRAYSQNIITVAAVGNSGTSQFDVAFPARYPEVIGVAAYDKSRKVASFSSRGVNVRFAMPGVDIYSTYPPNSYAKLSGSSFACPLLSGICALILSSHRSSGSPLDTPEQIMNQLKQYSRKLGDPNETGFGTVDLDQMFK